MGYYYGFDPTYILVIIGAVICMLASSNVNNTYRKYAKIRSRSGMTGAEAAARIRAMSGIHDVSIQHISGDLTDHYDPSRKVLRLSDAVYDSHSVAAIGVAAQECGHAVQHAYGYAPLRMRSALVPVVSFASTWVQWVLLAGILLVESFPGILLLGIALFAMTTLFSFITLPVEIDASRRATAWLQRAGLTSAYDHPMAVAALRSAAYTYVVAALGSLATLVYYVMIFLGRSGDD